jgi:hypothetical protein
MAARPRSEVSHSCQIRASAAWICGFFAGFTTYTLTDRATWANFKNRQNLAILVQGDTSLFNPYGIVPVGKNSCSPPTLNEAMAARPRSEVSHSCQIRASAAWIPARRRRHPVDAEGGGADHQGQADEDEPEAERQRDRARPRQPDPGGQRRRLRHQPGGGGASRVITASASCRSVQPLRLDPGEPGEEPADPRGRRPDLARVADLRARP